MSGNWKERTYRHTDETQSFPFIQWVNQGDYLEPRSEKGGFAAPIDQGLAIPGTAANMHHRNGETTEVIYTPELTVAVITTRFAWVKDGLRLPSYQRGARGKLQVLCYVQTVDPARPALAMLTFSGLASRSFSRARRAFADSVRKATDGQAPSWAFWMTVRAGPVKMVGSQQQSAITTVELAREVEPDRDYVGDRLADGIEALLDREAPRWRAAWSTGGTNGEGEIAGGEEVEPLGNLVPLAMALELPLPTNSKGYATIGDAVEAGDRTALESVRDWAAGQGKAALADACQAALAALLQEEIPF